MAALSIVELFAVCQHTFYFFTTYLIEIVLHEKRLEKQRLYKYCDEVAKSLQCIENIVRYKKSPMRVCFHNILGRSINSFRCENKHLKNIRDIFEIGSDKINLLEDLSYDPVNPKHINRLINALMNAALFQLHKKLKLKDENAKRLKLLIDCGKEVNQLEIKLNSVFTSLPFLNASTANKVLGVSQIQVKMEVVKQL
jgi:hypothetical protein